MYDVLSYLTENCCGGKPEPCKPTYRGGKRKKETV